MKSHERNEAASIAATGGIGPRLFRFAILADTHLTAEDGVSPSPWKTNALANERALEHRSLLMLSIRAARVL